MLKHCSLSPFGTTISYRLGSGSARFLYVLWVSLFTLALATLPSQAQDSSAKSFVESIYRSYLGSDATGPIFSGPKTSLYFDAAMTALIDKDRMESEARGTSGRLDFDPFINAQDFSITALSIKIGDENADRTQALVSFRNAKRPVKIILDLVRTPQGWRVANIAWPGLKETLISILRKPL